MKGITSFFQAQTARKNEEGETVVRIRKTCDLGRTVAQRSPRAEKTSSPYTLTQLLVRKDQRG